MAITNILPLGGKTDSKQFEIDIQPIPEDATVHFYDQKTGLELPLLRTLVVTTDPANATVTFTSNGSPVVESGYDSETGAWYGVNPNGTTIHYVVSKTPVYSDIAGDILMDGNKSTHVTLDLAPYMFTILPNPSDATVILTAPGYLQQGNSITVKSGTNVTWSVSKSGYITETGNNIITQNLSLPVKLDPDVPASEDWEYTVESDNSAILTKYIGTNPVVVGPDYVKGDL